MAYILLVNPAMLTLAIGDGTDAGNAQAFADILFATAIAAFVGCVVMGLWANLPFALAPGMGLNAYFTFTVVNFGMGIAWELALFAVFVEGLLFLVMSLPQIPVVGTWRSEMINSIPTDLKVATGAGIGIDFWIVYLVVVIFSYNGATWGLAQRFISVGDPRDTQKAALLSGFLFLLYPLVIFIPAWASPLLMPEFFDPTTLTPREGFDVDQAHVSGVGFAAHAAITQGEFTLPFGCQRSA